jgi:hypothetical protein
MPQIASSQIAVKPFFRGFKLFSIQPFATTHHALHSIPNPKKIICKRIVCKRWSTRISRHQIFQKVCVSLPAKGAGFSSFGERNSRRPVNHGYFKINFSVKAQTFLAAISNWLLATSMFEIASF